MVMHVLDKDGLPIHDPGGNNLLVVGGNIVTQLCAPQRVNADRVPIMHDRTLIAQPALGARIQFFMNNTATAFPFADCGGGAIVAAMAPARVSHDPIDCSTRTGAALYDRATKSVFVDPKNQYDLESSTLMDFLDAISRRARECGCGWEIFTINNAAGDAKNLLMEYGDLTTNDVRVHATTVLGSAPVTRAAQEEAQLFVCINNSLTQGAINVLNLHEAKFV